MEVKRFEEKAGIDGEIPRRIGLALALALAFTAIYSTIQWFIVGLEIPAWTGNGSADIAVFFGVQIFLWFLVWYWIFRLRNKLKRIRGEV